MSFAFSIAGIMFAPYKLTPDGFESHWAVNYLGHFLLQHLLLPHLKAAGSDNLNARIVNVSSCAHLLGRINYQDINATLVSVFFISVYLKYSFRI